MSGNNGHAVSIWTGAVHSSILPWIDMIELHLLTQFTRVSFAARSRQFTWSENVSITSSAWERWTAFGSARSSPLQKQRIQIQRSRWNRLPFSSQDLSEARSFNIRQTQYYNSTPQRVILPYNFLGRERACVRE